MRTKSLLAPIWLLVAVLVVTSESRKRRHKASLKFKDCGVDPSRPLHFHHVDAHPMPIVIPGTLHVNLKGNITHALPRRINVDLSVRKYIFGFPFIIPCINGKVGSCTYENICQYLERFEAYGCPRVLVKQRIPCHCPFREGKYSVRNLAINLPKVVGFAAMFIHTNQEPCSSNSANLKEPKSCFTCDDPKVAKACKKFKGEYEIRARVLSDGGKELGCLELRFTMKRRHRGWFFKI
ncbi:ganglioside GM2 activator-like [Liolophura sinensis]|uniref:ganglioside GM2 activator-like n=1 Tax=Liolophura sinensis TaxID=3198878 RepID=UPI0031582D3D